MRRFFALVFCLACTAPAIPAVNVAPLPTAATTSVESTLLGECRIAGTGERVSPTIDGEMPDFGVFVARGSKEPSLIVAEPRMANIVWSHFPHMGERDGRARVALGGQKHIRFEGYASLAGRTFSAGKRMFAEPGHLWARAGAPIEMVAAEGNVAIARVATSFVAPKILALRGPCDDVLYVPEEPEHAEPHARKALGTVENRAAAMPLYAAPSGQPFTTLTLEGDHELSLDVLDRRDGFVRVAGEKDWVAFDAWMRESDVDEAEEGLIGLGAISTFGRCGGMYSSQHGVVVRDAQLYVGETKVVAVSAAFVEKDAEVLYMSGEERTVDGHVLMEFDFEDHMFRAPPESRMWIARDAVQSK